MTKNKSKKENNNKFKKDDLTVEGYFSAYDPFQVFSPDDLEIGDFLTPGEIVREKRRNESPDDFA